MCDIFRGDREVIDFICDLVVGLDCGNVGIDQDGLDTSFLESFESLGTCRLKRKKSS